MNELGYEEGANCNRDGCDGVIELEKVDNCSCHISAPCSGHENQDTWCPECGWRAKDDPLCVQDMGTIYPGSGFAFVEPKKRVLDPTKIDWVPELHTAASMIKKGVFPIGTPRDEVEKAVRGTFGGRFECFNAEKGQFKYIAYTD
ncbi:MULTISPECIES: hypothetical protein [unclassified Pseudomonas]|uniref:hypothetical protein n=1 Tax=unclassified Pseudomonas TaxID=196821 RepID=UPI0002A434B7|nr:MULTISPECIES: hypothetical protein [unclassified Pseudomonas]MBB1606505.1 hypothetical protein [Pseudomonas sp. UMC76]MBB1640722.1 hypothetical protein [Pseudomonas sp. UME83]NTX88144.1 hypothetical protein [Pseudomonas sp. UMA643]NTY18717.1 hypothetical protein [Pseudomonas sp. UMC3103]NTY23979.1 hypothetical protein [Pseudomonas sp. UMA603]